MRILSFTQDAAQELPQLLGKGAARPKALRCGTLAAHRIAACSAMSNCRF